MRVMMASIFFATLTMPNTSTIQGSTSRPLGTKASTDNSILRKITLVTMTRHMEPNILHQPVKMSDVFLLPPTPKAKGAHKVRTARMMYRSAISRMRLNTLNITMRPQITTRSHAAARPAKEASSAKVMLTASGISR